MLIFEAELEFFVGPEGCLSMMFSRSCTIHSLGPVTSAKPSGRILTQDREVKSSETSSCCLPKVEEADIGGA